MWTATAAAKLTGVTVSSTETVGGFHQMLTVVAVQAQLRHRRRADGQRRFRRAERVADDHEGRLAGVRGRQRLGQRPWPAPSGPARASSASGSTPRWATPSGPSASPRRPVRSGSVVTINDTAPTGDRWNLAAVEIKGL